MTSLELKVANMEFIRYTSKKKRKKVTIYNNNRNRYWCFTIWGISKILGDELTENFINNSNEYIDKVKLGIQSYTDKVFFNNNNVQFIMCGLERGNKREKETKGWHIQSFITFRKKVGFKNVFNTIGLLEHLEPCAGSASQNTAYCKKEKNWICSGELPVNKQGARTDLLYNTTHLNKKKRSFIKEEFGPNGIPKYSIADNSLYDNLDILIKHLKVKKKMYEHILNLKKTAKIGKKFSGGW